MLICEMGKRRVRTNENTGKLGKGGSRPQLSESNSKEDNTKLQGEFREAYNILLLPTIFLVPGASRGHSSQCGPRFSVTQSVTEHPFLNLPPRRAQFKLLGTH